MSTEQAEAPKAEEGAPAQAIPSRPAKDAKKPKDKAPKGPKNAGLEVRPLPPPFDEQLIDLKQATRSPRIHQASTRHFRQDQG